MSERPWRNRERFFSRKTQLLFLIAGFGILAYLLISFLIPLNDRVLSLFFSKSAIQAATMKKETEFYSNQILIKVKRDARGKLKVGNAKDVGIPSLNQKLKKMNPKKIERVIVPGNKSNQNNEIFDWYKLTLSGKEAVAKGLLNKEKKKLEPQDNNAKTLLANIDELKADVNIVTAEPNVLITPLQSSGVQLTYPNGGQSFKTGDRVRITWSTTATGSCSLYYFVGSNTTTVHEVGYVNNASIGYYDWTVSAPGQVVGTSYQVKVQMACVGQPVEYSDNFFTITVSSSPTPTFVPTPTPSTPYCFNQPQVSFKNKNIVANPGQTVTNEFQIYIPNNPSCGTGQSAPLGISWAYPKGLTVKPDVYSVVVKYSQLTSVPVAITIAPDAAVNSHLYQMWASSWGPADAAIQVTNDPVATPTSAPITPTLVPSPTATAPTPTPTPSHIPNDPYYQSSGTWGQNYPDMWGLKKMDIENAWAISTGSPDIVVAVIDSGVDRNHEDLQDNMWVNSGETPGNGIDDDGNGYADDYYGWDMMYNDNDPSDIYGHGTVVSGTVAAVGNNGKGVVGVAWDAQIMPIKVLGDGGTGTWEAGARGLVYAADSGADIANNSWGANYYSQIVEDAIRYAHDRGVTVIAAAGNNGLDMTNYSPAGNERTISVGAVDVYDQRSWANWWSSNYGPRLDVTGPGLDILTTKSSTASCMGHPIVGTAYCRVPGTSLSSPHVAGLAALLLSKYPTLTNEEVRQIIRYSSVDIGTPGPDIYYGYGRVNAGNAMQFAAVRPLAPVITYPVGHSSVGGTQSFLGSTGDANFAGYTLEAGLGNTPGSWTQLANKAAPVSAGELARVDLSTLSQGVYTLRLTARSSDNKEYRFQTHGINVVGSATATNTPVPTPTAIPTSGATVTPTPQPAPPENLTATPISTSQIQLQWQAPVSGPTIGVYNIYRNGNRIVQGNVLQYTNNNLQPNTTYSYFVEPQYLDGSVGPRSSTVTATTFTEPTLAPTVTPLPTPTATPSPAPTNTPTPTLTPEPTATPLPTATPTSIPTPTPAPDITPPTVTIASPANNAVVRDDVTISVNATDSSGVTYVAFYADDAHLATDTISPYQHIWDTNALENGTYVLRVRAYDAAGNYTDKSVSVTVNNPDTTPPTDPTGLTGTASSYNRIDLQWNASTDNVGVAGYWVIRNGTTFASMSGTLYADTTVQPETAYTYQIIAFDDSGNNSGGSNTVTITTPSVPDTTPPTIPSGIVATAVSASQINLSWNAATDNIGVTGYEVYRNNARVATVTTLSYGDAGLAAATQYIYTVRAIDAAGDVSEFSSAVSATTLNPPIVNGAITGTVSSASGPVISAKVSTVVSGVTKTTYTDSNGTYTLGNIPPAIYPVTYAAKRLKSQAVNVTVNNGETTTQDVVLSGGSKGNSPRGNTRR